MIRDGDKSVYQREVDQLVHWCSRKKLGTLKTVEMMVDFRKHSLVLISLTISHSSVVTVVFFRFWGTIVSHDLK